MKAEEEEKVSEAQTHRPPVRTDSLPVSHLDSVCLSLPVWFAPVQSHFEWKRSGGSVLDVLNVEF